MITINHLRRTWPDYEWSVTSPTDKPELELFKACKSDKYVAMSFEPHHTLTNFTTKGGVEQLLKQLDEATV